MGAPINVLAVFDSGNVLRASVWHVAKNDDEVIADHAEAIQLDPHNAAGYVSRGFCGWI